MVSHIFSKPLPVKARYHNDAYLKSICIIQKFCNELAKPTTGDLFLAIFSLLFDFGVGLLLKRPIWEVGSK
jgi:hypothetical protein